MNLDRDARAPLGREDQELLAAVLAAVAELGRQRGRMTADPLAWLQDFAVVLADAETALVHIRDRLLDDLEQFDDPGDRDPDSLEDRP